MDEKAKLEIVWLNPNELIPYEDNERKISLEDFTQLKASITRLGFIDPIIVNSSLERKNIIVGGHQRHLAATELGMDSVPVIYRNYTLEQETEARLRLNRNTGEYDWQKLRKFDSDYLTSIGFSLTDIQMVFTDDFSAIDQSLKDKSGNLNAFGDKIIITFEVKKEDEEWVKNKCDEFDWDLAKILKELK